MKNERKGVEECGESSHVVGSDADAETGGREEDGEGLCGTRMDQGSVRGSDHGGYSGDPCRAADGDV